MLTHTTFSTIVPEEKGRMRNVALIFTAIIGYIVTRPTCPSVGPVTCAPEKKTFDVWAAGLDALLIPLLILWIYAWYWESKRVIDHHNRVCTNCKATVQTNAVVQTNTCEVLAVSDSTRAITSSNPVVGVTSSGGHMGVGVGTMQSTSHVPVKLGRVKLTVSCPSCNAFFSWIENREIVQWTDPSGQVSYEIPGMVTLP